MNTTTPASRVTRHRPLALLAAVLLGCVAEPARAQDGVPTVAIPTRAIPVRQLGRIVSSDSTVLMGVASVRHLPTGGVIVNDATKRQLVVFDSTLTTYKIIADTSTDSPNSYGLRGSVGGLIPYVGDSTIFVDTESGALLLIDGQGRFARVMAPVRANDLYFISSGGFGLAGFDPKGRMVYRTQRRALTQMFNLRDPSGKPVPFTNPDSAPILRADFDKRTVDTIAIIKSPVDKGVMISSPTFMTSYQMVNPLPVGDEWVLLPDGAIAIVRGQDYHIDWLAPDGKITSSPKMPFDWKRITLEEKQAMLDSLKKADAARVAKLPPPPPPIPGQFVMPNRPFVTVDVADLPDYYPAVRQGQVRADPQGNVWILPSTSLAAKGGLLYDVVNRNGEVFERVQLPAGRTLVGFSKNGSIYMNNVKSPTRAAIERADVIRAVP